MLSIVAVSPDFINGIIISALAGFSGGFTVGFLMWGLSSVWGTFRKFTV